MSMYVKGIVNVYLLCELFTIVYIYMLIKVSVKPMLSNLIDLYELYVLKTNDNRSRAIC